MSVSTTVKNQLMDIVQARPSVKRTYGHEEMNPSGWPAVFVTATSMQGDFIDTAHNSRVYSFRLTIVFPIGQDMPNLPSGTNRLEYAEQTIATVLDEIINAVDTEFELEGTPVLYVNAADADWGEAAIDVGIVKAVQVTLRIYTEFQIQ
jgi:hypothetical protein